MLGLPDEPALRRQQHKERRDYMTIITDKGPIRLYYHKTDGGAEYLTDKFLVCPNGFKEGIFEGATVIVRLDGEPELTSPIPDLLEALRECLGELEDIVHADGGDDSQAMKQASAAIAKAQGK